MKNQRRATVYGKLFAKQKMRTPKGVRMPGWKITYLLR